MTTTNPSIFQRVLSSIRKAVLKFESSRDAESATWHLNFGIEHDEPENVWVSWCVEMPGCVAQGDSAEEALENVVETAMAMLEIKMQEGVKAQLEELRKDDAPNSTRKVAIAV